MDNEKPKRKTVTVAFQLRVTKDTDRASIEQHIKAVLTGAVVLRKERTPALYKDRVEVFMP